MKLIVLSSKNYENVEVDYGDCFIIDCGANVVVFDCGSETHADKVIEYLDEKGIDKIDIVLSHNDDDHYKGIPKLIDQGRVNKVYTVLLLKYKDEILDKIDDERKTRESLSNQIIEIYDNIKELEGYLGDALETPDIYPGVKVIGPDKDYLIEAIAHQLNATEGDQIDGTTIINATSIHLSVELSNQKILLTGDAVVEAFEDKMDDYQVVQLPHHGNSNQAEQVFDKMNGKNDVVYIISDNTGTKNAGSDSIYEQGLDKGHRIKNTKYEDTFEVTDNSFILKPTSNLGEVYHAIYNYKQ